MCEREAGCLSNNNKNCLDKLLACIINNGVVRKSRKEVSERIILLPSSHDWCSALWRAWVDTVTIHSIVLSSLECSGVLSGACGHCVWPYVWLEGIEWNGHCDSHRWLLIYGQPYLRTHVKLLGTYVVWEDWKGLELGQSSAYQVCKAQKLLRA